MGASSIWSPIAVIVTVLFLASIVVFVRNLRKYRVAPASPEERAELASLPMTPLQKRAWWGLIVGLAMALAIVGVISIDGPVAYFDNDDLRLIVLVFIFGALASYLFVIVPLGWQEARHGSLDERDRKILMVAPNAQSVASLLTVVAWSIALTEAYRGEPGIPTGFMYLISWSVFVVQAIAYPAGVLLGYWFARSHGQG
jgi:hypothetical protein